VPVPAEFMSAQSAIVGLRGKDLLTTVRSLAVHGLRQPLHSARHLVAFGGQLGKVLLGDTLHQPNPQDARFQDPSWRLNPFYRRTLQAYLAWQKQLLAWIDESNLDCDDRARARFLVALLSDAVAPSNSLINPLALKELFNTGGISLLNGVRHLLEDLVHNGGMPSQVNKTAFEIGRNLATTQGAVVFRNEVLELIQYKPLGERQYAKPLLIVPPQINKYYIFDLSPEKSFVQYALKNNLQVFVISWRNPDAQHREWGLSTYVEALDDMAKVFAWMRPNDLIWNYWVNNYLLGRQPPAFDILYWNNDNTRLPAAFHGELLDLFKHNPLTRPGALEVSGTAVDLGKVAIDSFHVAGITDHITPWDAVYRSALLLGGQRRFILSNSGHIQSILNPPGNPKACYFENDKLSSDPRAWYYDAKREEGSWWPVWLGWLQERSGELGNPDFNLGSAAHPPLEAAPGTYVHIR